MTEKIRTLHKRDCLLYTSFQSFGNYQVGDIAYADWNNDGMVASSLISLAPLVATITAVSYTHLDVYKRQLFLYFVIKLCYIFF